ASVQPNLSAETEIIRLLFGADGSGYSLTGTNSLKLTSEGTGSNSAITANNTSGSNTVSAPIILGQSAGKNATFYLANTGSLAVSGAISSANANVGLTLNGNKISLSSAGSSYTGGTTLEIDAVVEVSKLANGGANSSIG